jgi:LacI family transcriptional regulator
MDDAQAGDDMTTHLVNFGHRRIGFVKGHPSHMASEERLYGYRKALDRAGIGFEPALVIDGTFDFDSGVSAAAMLLDLPEPPTAIFAANDDMAAGVLAEAHRRAIEVPAALSVAGFDDTTLARTVWPPLTTIHQPMIELARTAAEILIAGGDISHRRLAHQLVERASVAPPPRKFI